MNKRILSIISELCRTNSEITINSLAEKHKLSQRTIRNDLNAVSDFLRENNLDELHLKSGGIVRKGDDFEKILPFLSDRDFYTYKLSKEERVKVSVSLLVKIGKAIRSGLMIGVGFVGLGLIVDMMNAELGPAAQGMSERFGLSLSVVDIGWPGASPMTWSSNIATLAIPVAIAVNILMILLKLTKTVNIDIWNIWHMTFTGAIAYAVTENFGLGVLGVVVHAVISYKFYSNCSSCT